MDTKYQTTGRSHRQIASASHSLSPKLEERVSRNDEVSVRSNYMANLSRKTNLTSLPPALTKDRKYPSLESVMSSPSKISIRNELVSSEKISRKFEPLKPASSAETLNSDIYLQKRPIKLAPLNLPEEVKEAQLKKMKDEVYLAKKSYKTIDKTARAFNDQPIRRDPINKVGMAEQNLERVKVEHILPKNSKGLQGYKPSIVPLSGNSRERMSSSSTSKIKSGHVHNSVPKIVTVDSTDVSVKGRFNHAKSHNTNQGILKPMKVNRLGMD